MSSNFKFNPTDYNKRVKPDSSNIDTIAFSRANSEYPLAISFKSGGTYVYRVQDIPDETGKPIGPKGASSLFYNLDFGAETKDGEKKNSSGAAFWKMIRGKCGYEKIANSNIFNTEDNE